jgi:hypothetical protein
MKNALERRGRFLQFVRKDIGGAMQERWRAGARACGDGREYEQGWKKCRLGLGCLSML